MATQINGSAVAGGNRTYLKVPGRVGLYRHARSGLYYGCKKMHGTRSECSLRTADRQIAERRLKDWIRKLEVVDREVERTRLRQLLARFAKITDGKAAK